MLSRLTNHVLVAASIPLLFWACGTEDSDNDSTVSHHISHGTMATCMKTQYDHTVSPVDKQIRLREVTSVSGGTRTMLNPGMVVKKLGTANREGYTHVRFYPDLAMGKPHGYHSWSAKFAGRIVGADRHVDGWIWSDMLRSCDSNSDLRYINGTVPPRSHRGVYVHPRSTDYTPYDPEKHRETEKENKRIQGEWETARQRMLSEAGRGDRNLIICEGSNDQYDYEVLAVVDWLLSIVEPSPEPKVLIKQKPTPFYDHVTRKMANTHLPFKVVELEQTGLREGGMVAMKKVWIGDKSNPVKDIRDVRFTARKFGTSSVTFTHIADNDENGRRHSMNLSCRMSF